MKNQKSQNVITISLITIAFITQIMSLSVKENAIVDKILNFAFIIGLASAFYYVLVGYKKDVSKYYKLFMIIYALASLWNALSTYFYSLSSPIQLTGIIKFVCLGLPLISALFIFILAFVKDLGKKKSLIFAIINFIAVFSVTLLGIIMLNNTTQYYGVHIGNVCLALIALLLVIGKYVDKDSRGAK